MTRDQIIETIGLASLQALEDAGLVVVPREPTEEMENAGAMVVLNGKPGWQYTRDIYTAMISTLLKKQDSSRDHAPTNCAAPVASDVADPQPAKLCRRPGGCVCGGDTPGVRAGCSWWRGDD